MPRQSIQLTVLSSSLYLYVNAIKNNLTSWIVKINKDLIIVCFSMNLNIECCDNRIPIVFKYAQNVHLLYKTSFQLVI